MKKAGRTSDQVYVGPAARRWLKAMDLWGQAALSFQDAMAARRAKVHQHDPILGDWEKAVSFCMLEAMCSHSAATAVGARESFDLKGVACCPSRSCPKCSSVTFEGAVAAFSAPAAVGAWKKAAAKAKEVVSSWSDHVTRSQKSIAALEQMVTAFQKTDAKRGKITPARQNRIQNERRRLAQIWKEIADMKEVVATSRALIAKTQRAVAAMKEAAAKS